jgi:DNA-binding CsgD family transcriptional regulator
MAIKKKVFLTKKQKSEIVRLKNKGETVKELAAAYNVSEGTIYSTIKAAPTRKPRTEVTAAMADEMLELRSAGMSMNKIADMMGLGYATVARHLKKLGDPMKAKAVTTKPILTKEEVVELTKPDGVMMYTDEGPQVPMTSKKGDDFMEGIKITFGIAVVLGLFFLFLEQAGVL